MIHWNSGKKPTGTSACIGHPFQHMDGEVDWKGIEDSCTENRELAEIIRWLERFQGGNPPVDWKEARQRCADALTAFLEASEESQELIQRLHGAEYEIGGDEHYVVRVDSDPERVFKITHGDAFRCFSFFSPHDPDLNGKHFHGSINEDPVLYLRRWMLLNSFTDYITRFEGLLPPEGKLRMPRICLSQPALDAQNPTRQEICEQLAAYGFERISEDAFLHFENRILLTDAAPRNVRVIDGQLALFDAIASMATIRIYDWATLRH